MLKRKLVVLNHPNPEQFNVHDETEFRSAVLWLEDQKIRNYKIEDRGPLRNLSDPDWNKAFESYQNDLGSPVVNATPIEQLTWLISLAIRLEYSDNAAALNAAIIEKSKIQTSTPNVVSTNPLDKLDFTSDAFTSGIARVAALGCVGPHIDPRIRLSALATVIKNTPHPPPTGQNTETCETPSDVMNLLFVSDLRSLQTSINETLVAIQKITANPKTDTSLGKVGF